MGEEKINFQRIDSPLIGFDFTTKDYLTQKDIELMANNYANHLGRDLMFQEDGEPKVIYLLDGLSMNSILGILKSNRFFDIDNEKEAIHFNSENTAIDFQELQYFLGIIRKAILEALKKYDFLSEQDYYMVERRYGANRALALSGDVFYKRHITHESLEAFAKARSASLEILQQHPHPNILFAVEGASENYTEVLSPKVDLVDLETLIIKEQLDLKKSLQIILENMRGAIHLLEHNLIIGDINPRNLGYLPSQDKGVLFDFDALVPQGTNCEGRICLNGYEAPEVTATPGSSPITAAELVFQFGQSLDFVVFKTSKEDNKNLTKLVQDMTVYKPENRPELLTCFATLQEIIDTL